MSSIRSPITFSPATAPMSSDCDPDEWFLNETPSRQATDTTVASESDARGYLNKPLLGAPDKQGFVFPPRLRSQSDAMITQRLAVLKEQRGWKHFLRHQAAIPFAFVSGITIGLMAAMLLPFMLTPAQVSSVSPAWQQQQPTPYLLTPPPYWVPSEYYSSKPLDNSCLIPKLSMPTDTSKPQTFDACAFVIKSTDEVWNLRGDVDAAIEKYFHDDYVDAGSWGNRIIGKKALKAAVLSEMRAFPDIQIHITDCICKGNDVDGYKCAMPDVLTGTNWGPSGYGPATGRRAKWTGLVESLVKQNPKTGQWQYYAEWGVHDEWSLLQQLGLDFARIPHVPSNIEPMHDCNPLVQFPQNGTAMWGAQMDKPDVAEQFLHRAERFPSA